MIDVTDSAIGEFKKVLEQDENKGMAIKIVAAMSQGGCSCGPAANFEMGLVEEAGDGDKSFDIGGVQFHMDESSIEMMGNRQVDFMDEQGFIVRDLAEHDHNGGGGCGCGDGGSHNSCGC
jgi:Fe-S cluster assembly iron-binding protein IscA